MASISFDSGATKCIHCGAAVKKVVSMKIAHDGVQASVLFACGSEVEQRPSGDLIIHAPCPSAATKETSHGG
jgi:hypothetical protein